MRLLLSLLILTLSITSTSALSSLRQRSSRWSSNAFSRSSAGGQCCEFFSDCYLGDRCSSTCCWIFESSLGMLEEQAVKDGKHAIQHKQQKDDDEEDNTGENYDVAAIQTSSHTKSSKDKHTMTQEQREDGDDADSDENDDMSAIEQTSTRWHGTPFGLWLSNLLRQNQNTLNGFKPQKFAMSGGSCCDNYTWCELGNQCDGTCCWAYENGLGLIETQTDSKQQSKAKNLFQAAQKAQAHHKMKISSKAQHKINSHKQRIQTSQ